jgi:hypothetical protein
MREAWIIDAARSRVGVGKPGKGAFPPVLPHSIMAVNALWDHIALVADETDGTIIGGFGGRAAAFHATPCSSEVGILSPRPSFAAGAAVSGAHAVNHSVLAAWASGARGPSAMLRRAE